MKTNLVPKAQSSGSALLTVLVICSVLTISVMGYLTLIEFQSRMSTRSQTWNLAIAVAEAGVEEGLEQLNQNNMSLAQDGWTYSGGTYNITRTTPDGNSYTVNLNVSDPANPFITSRAYVYPPALAQIQQTVYFATAGLNTAPSSMTRAVLVHTSRSAMFAASMVAKKTINLNGNGVLSDSYDSGDPTKSTNGNYDPAKAGDFGDVASNLGIVNAISVQNANIYGHLHVGPNGTATIGSQGGVGSHAWQASNNGFEPGWAADDANFTFPTTTLPYTSGPTPQPGTIVSVAYSTNTTYVNGTQTYPVSVPVGTTMSAVTTNASSVTSSSYPGSQPGLTTNTTYVTAASYPGSQPGLTTNYISFITVSSYPGQKPALTTNLTSTTTSSYPVADTYVGSVSTNYAGNGNSQTIKSYTYKLASYTYANQFSYTYATYTYTYPLFTYTYTLYLGIPIYTTNSYNNILWNGDYVATSLSGTTYVAGKARLVLPNGLSMSGNDQFIIGPGGSVQVYADGSSLTVGGNGVINPSGFAGNFILYGTPNVTSLTYNGNGTFTGVIVAPSADLTMNGSGNTPQDFSGALMVNSVKMNGHFGFHYDQALGRMPLNGRYLITSWDEIP